MTGQPQDLTRNLTCNLAIPPGAGPVAKPCAGRCARCKLKLEGDPKCKIFKDI